LMPGRPVRPVPPGSSTPARVPPRGSTWVAARFSGAAGPARTRQSARPGGWPSDGRTCVEHRRYLPAPPRTKVPDPRPVVPTRRLGSRCVTLQKDPNRLPHCRGVVPTLVTGAGGARWQ
jgi:hypothetical protein